MNGFAPNILGLDAGARQIEVSVLRGEELVFYGVKSIKGRSKSETLKRLEKVLAALIEKYDIEVIAVKKIAYLQQQHSFARTVNEEIKVFALKNNIRLYEYHPTIIRRTICRNEKPIKQNTEVV